MTRTRFIHTSDWQIGMKRGFLPAEAHSRFDADRLAAIKKLGDLATEQDCEFIVVAGDVFDANSLNATTTGRTMEVLRNLAVPVYLLPGNHDPLVANNIFRFTDAIDNVHVIRDNAPIEIRPGVELVGAPYLSKRVSTDIVAEALEDLEPAEDGSVRIAVGHGQVESRSNDDDSVPIDLATVECAVDRRVIDYLALGDTHSTASLGSTGRVWFSGSPEVTDYRDFSTVGGGEKDSGNALVVDIEATGSTSQVTVEPHHIGTWTWHALEYDIASHEDAEAFISALREYPDKATTVVKYALVGTATLDTMRYLEEQLADLESIFAALYRRERTYNLLLAPSEEELENLGLGGYVGAAMTDLIEQADTDDTASDAVGLLHRLIVSERK
ncbi:DNA repair exonuclease [Corynebacterium sp. 11A]|uniref:metallophosphoesterase family protein n=1 Tax=Corynebacterium sp. 11A TaxID=2080510 RepID=UPI00124EEEEF|nr:DNA repair exonuclease [Corynebacterium sp. 11A]